MADKEDRPQDTGRTWKEQFTETKENIYEKLGGDNEAKQKEKEKRGTKKTSAVIEVKQVSIAEHTSDNEPEPWTHDLFSCFGDMRLCIFTFLCPCYTMGRNAEALSEDCIVAGILYGLGCWALGPVVRWRIRAAKNIEGNMVTDVILHAVLPCCSLIQENKELYGMSGAHIGERIPLAQDMPRK